MVPADIAGTDYYGEVLAMKHILSKGAFVFVFAVVSASESLAQSNTCAEIARNPIFTKSSYDRELKSSASFKSLLCSASWKNASEAQAAGVEATIPIYGLAVPFTANWSDSKVDQWKNSNCTSEERAAFYQDVLHTNTLKISPTSADDALECAKEEMSTKAVRCSVSEGEGTIIFEAEWRRTAGELDTATPIIKELTSINATCLNLSEMAEKQLLKEGGTSLLCKRGDDSPMFSLNTSRGQCFAYGISKKDIVELGGTVIMDHPTTFKGARVVLKGDLKVVTQGYPLQIIADDKLEIQGSPQIISFLPVAKNLSEPGRSAQSIFIKGRKLQGAGLSILNAGEDGGQGRQGPKGSTGPQGAPGAGRDPVTGSGGGFLGQVIELVPKSCTGGRNGDAGGKGGTGLQGTQGAAGGAAGLVVLSLPPDTDPNTSIMVLTDVGLDGKHRSCGGRICGGLGGAGGVGGTGGDGGPGGPGAPGTTWCGGTSDGGRGAQGDSGPGGAVGDPGPDAIVQYN